MVSPEELTARSLRAYEAGRFLASLRVALVIVPIAVLCLLEPEGRGTCACLAVVLLGGAVWLRFRDRRGVRAVTTGLLASAIPLASGVLLSHFELRCGLAGGETFCSAVSLLLGLGAGVFVSSREARWGPRLSGLVTAAAITGLAAGLGCVRLGVFGLLALFGGIALGALTGTWSRRNSCVRN
jgi:hypothetical protein